MLVLRGHLVGLGEARDVAGAAGGGVGGLRGLVLDRAGPDRAGSQRDEAEADAEDREDDGTAHGWPPR